MKNTWKKFNNLFPAADCFPFVYMILFAIGVILGKTGYLLPGIIVFSIVSAWGLWKILEEWNKALLRRGRN